MQRLDHGPLADNATLLCRIVELEHERDELRRNAEQASALQPGIFGGLDLVSRIQGRRASGLEQDLTTCEQKLNAYQKENIKLQEELSEAYIIKSKFADLLKAEVEKNTGLEKEVKYFQNQVASALSERDRSLAEIGRLQRKKDGLIEKITELQDRLDHVTSEYAEEKILCEVLYSKLEKLKEENNLYKKVAERFWRVREQVSKTFDVEDIQDRAAILLQDPEGLWSYGETNLNLCSNQAKQVKGKEDLQACCTPMANLQGDVQKENCNRKQVENALPCCRQQQPFCWTEFVRKELQQLSLFKRSLKEDVSSFFLEEQELILRLQESLHLVMNVECAQNKEYNFNKVDKSNSNIVRIEQEEISEADTKFSCSRATSEDEETASVNDFMEMGLDKSGVSGVSENKIKAAESFSGGEFTRETLEDPHLGHVTNSRGLAVSDESLPSTDDSKLLAQALQEKVAALLLLSQQEERHILESNTAFAMESQISFLKQQLLQVTTEKMDALVKLACSQEKCLKLQAQEKNFKRLIQHNQSPVAEPVVPLNDGKDLVSFTSKKASISYLRHLWPRQGLGIHTKSLSHMLSLNRGKEDDVLNVARLRAENTSLRESLSCIGHLCKSINRLRQTIDRIAVQSNAQTASFFESAAEEVDGVISEALHLKVVFKKSPTHNDLGWDSIGSPLTGTREMAFQDGSDGETNDDLDIVSSFGLQIVRLVLLAAQLQKRLLRQSS